jgi:LPXTG-motif cell wall-anchored protein
MNARRWLTALAMGLLAVCGWGAPAQAAGELGLSPDGVHWAATLPAPIFDPAFRWVPGDSETASFYVRNQAKEAGALTVTMLAPAVHDLIDSGDLTVSAQFENKPFVSVTTAGAHTLVDAVTVPPKGVRKITIRVAFDPTSPNSTEDKLLDLRFGVTLTQRGSAVSPPQTGTGHGNGGTGVSAPGGLPNTGSDTSPLMLLLAVLLCVGGAALAVVSQRTTHATKAKEEAHA